MKEEVIKVGGCFVEYREYHQPGHGSTLYRMVKIVQPSCVEDGAFVPASDVVMTGTDITRLCDFLNRMAAKGADTP